MATKKDKNREIGQGLVEYSLILILASIVVVAILTTLGPQVGNMFSRVTGGLDVAINGNGGNGARITDVTDVLRSGNIVGMRVFVSEDTTLDLTETHGGSSSGIACAQPWCVATIEVQGASGTISVLAPGNSVDVSY